MIAQNLTRAKHLLRSSAIVGAMVMVVVLAARQPGELLQPPYQIEAVLQDPVWVGSSQSSLGTDRLLVDFGNAEGKSLPRRTSLQKMVILFSEGLVAGDLQDVFKICRFLCGDDAEACHWVGEFTPRSPIADLGTPVLALPGSPALTVDRSALQSSEDDLLLPADWWENDFLRAVWWNSEHPGPEFRISEWVADSGSLTLEYRYSEKEVYRVDEEGCTVRQYQGLFSIACASVAVLAAEGVPLLVSYPDYNLPAAEVVSTFRHQGQDYFVVRLGLKAQTVMGLLVRTETGWQALFRPRDYPLIC